MRFEGKMVKRIDHFRFGVPAVVVDQPRRPSWIEPDKCWRCGQPAPVLYEAEDVSFCSACFDVYVESVRSRS